MKTIHISTQFTIYDHLEDCPPEIQDLMQQAIQARKKSYSPYSKFSVGAALLLENGSTVTGSNQENACYPAGLCAERTALFYAGAQYPQETMTAMAITASAADLETLEPVPPCGSCRQALSEYEVKQKMPLALYFMGASGKVMYSPSVENILPLLFTKKYL
ncbi:cytidine deaminase [Croceiramulus getboli]|nr:cytidine deaminase [Flavobacteriaceae bacterium YJPT1-3]